MIGIWYDDGFGFSDLDQIRILLKFFGADRIIKFQYPHNTASDTIVIQVEFATNVANSSYNKYTKSRLKIFQIYTKFIAVTKTNNLMLFFQCFFIVSRR